MLSRLSIRDIVLIDRLDIDFGSGLAALTGETGAGKSILLDAFALALGARGEAALVREGAEQGQVIAAFDVAKDHPARRVLAENDLGTGLRAGLGSDDELIVRRVQFADGRTRAFINDQPVSVQALRALGLVQAAAPDTATLEEALRLAEELGMRAEIAHCHAALAVAGGGDAAVHCAVAGRLYRDLGMSAWFERLQPAFAAGRMWYP